MADPEFSKWGRVSSAIGARKGGGMWGGMSPLTGGGIWGGGCAPFPENVWTFYLEIASFGAFWGVFKVYIPIFACHFCDHKGEWYDGAWT